MCTCRVRQECPRPPQVFPEEFRAWLATQPTIQEHDWIAVHHGSGQKKQGGTPRSYRVGLCIFELMVVCLDRRVHFWNKLHRLLDGCPKRISVAPALWAHHLLMPRFAHTSRTVAMARLTWTLPNFPLQVHVKVFQPKPDRPFHQALREEVHKHPLDEALTKAWRQVSSSLCGQIVLRMLRTS